MKKTFIIILILNCALNTRAQDFSIATHASVLQNLNSSQKFTVFGQMVQMQYHLSARQALYAGVSYYTQGKFTNNYSASALTGQNNRNFSVTGRYRYRQLSLGWQHYFTGDAFSEEHWGVYGIAGLGLLVNRVENQYDPQIDTLIYSTPNAPRAGSVTNNRLTLDLGLGFEYPLGGGIYVYGDARAWLPASSYPSPYLHDSFDFPKALSLNVGLRILFGGWSDQ